jgi:hypothetical protein
MIIYKDKYWILEELETNNLNFTELLTNLSSLYLKPYLSLNSKEEISTKIKTLLETNINPVIFWFDMDYSKLKRRITDIFLVPSSVLNEKDDSWQISCLSETGIFSVTVAPRDFNYKENFFSLRFPITLDAYTSLGIDKFEYKCFETNGPS